MTIRLFGRRLPHLCVLVIAILTGVSRCGLAQASSHSPKSGRSPSPASLEQDFFAAIRAGDSSKILSYVPERGVNVGPEAQHVSRDEVEQQFQFHRGLYCKLFDSSCIDAAINLGNSARGCSYRELLTHSEKVRTAASEVTRGGVMQAVLVAQIKNDQCPNQKLIDVIFNLQADGWKLFSVP
jgi:hypothetical protein